jgi:hypothetical protein
MKKIAYLFSALLILALVTGRVSARLTGTDPGTDVWCVGPSSFEICVDVLGNLIPTTTNIGSLGTSSLKWKDLILAGNATVGGTLTQTGSLTLGIASSLIKTPVAAAVLGAGGTISTVGACGGLIELSVTANRTTDTTDSLTAPTAGNKGCVVHIVNTGGGTISIDNNAHCFTGGTQMVLGTGDGASFIQGTSAWIQIGSSDNA